MGCRGREAAGRVADEAKRLADAAKQAVETAKREAEKLWQRLVDGARAPVDRLRGEIEGKLPGNASLLDAAKSTALAGAKTLVDAAIAAAKQAGGSALGPILQNLKACFDTGQIAAIAARVLGGVGQGPASAFSNTTRIMKPVNDFIAAKVTETFNKLKGDIQKKINEAKARFKTAQDEHQNNGWNKIQKMPPDINWVKDRIRDNFKSFVTAWNNAKTSLTTFKTEIEKLITDAKSKVEALKSDAAGKATSVIEEMKREAGKASSAARTTFSKILGAGQEFTKNAVGLVKCIYNHLRSTASKLKLPDFNQFETGIRNAMEFGGKLWDAMTSKKGQEQMRRDVEGIGKDLADKMLKEMLSGIPKTIDYVMGVREDIRGVLVLEGVSDIFDARQDKRNAANLLPNEIIDGVIARIKQPIKEPIERVAANFAGQEFVGAFLNTVSAPLDDILRFSLRGAAMVRTAIKNLLRPLLVKLLEGGVGMANKLRAVIRAIKQNLPPNSEDVIIAGFDKLSDAFGGAAGFLIESLGLKDTVLKVLDAIVGSFADVGSLNDQFKQMRADGRKGDSAGVVGKYQGVASGAYLAAASAQASRDADTARAAFEQKRNELRAKETALLAEMSTPILTTNPNDPKLSARARKIEEKRQAVKAAQLAVEAASEESVARARRAAALDPLRGEIKMIVAGWETLSEAFMKLSWDTFMAIMKKLVDDLVEYYVSPMVAIYAGVVSEILSISSVVTTYTPWIPELVGWAVNAYLAFYKAYLNFYFAMILPEYRVFVKDQVVSLKEDFVKMVRDPAKRATLQQAMSIVNEIGQGLAPIAERLKAVRAKVALGASGLMEGPLGDVLKQLPPELVAAMTNAITTGIKMLQKLGSQAAVEGTQMIISGGATGSITLPDPKVIAKKIVKALRGPLLDYFIAVLPVGPKFEKLKTAFGKFLKAAIDKPKKIEDEENPWDIIAPAKIVQRIGNGLKDDGAQEDFAGFLADGAADLAGVKDCAAADPAGDVKGGAGARSGTALDALKALIKAKLKVAADVVASGNLANASKLLKGGAYGIIREVVSGTRGLVACMLLKQVPDTLSDIKVELKGSISKAFDTFEKAGEMERVLGKGWKGVVAKVVEIANAPIIKLMLRDFPDGKAKGAVRAALLSLVADDAKVNTLLTLISEGGLGAVAGEVLATRDVAKAIAEVLTGDLGQPSVTDAVAGKIAARGADLKSTGAISAAFVKNGIGDIISVVAEPVETELIRQLTPGLVDPLKGMVVAAIKKGRTEIVAGRALPDVVRSVAGAMLVKLKTYLANVAARIDKARHVEVDRALRNLDEAMRAIGATAAEGQVAAAIVAADVAAGLKLLGNAIAGAQGFTFPAEVKP
ncbi:MAG: hypothetical protein HYY84_12055 [Deltaproteobacteria bacterium]|nr:hypothetical protein [Deltaproteobacteria bacterium]